MIKELFFTAALLAPGLAYGGNPSANLSVQIVPAGSPPVPAAAQAAGFTTLAANYDFSQPRYANPSSNWIDFNNVDNTKTWHNGIPGIPNVVNTIQQKVDALDGSTVLNMHLDVSTDCSARGGGSCVVGMVSALGTGENGAHYPHMYYETVIRSETTTSDTQYNYPMGVWTWPVGPGAPGTELDMVELQVDQGGYGNDGIGGVAQAWASYAPNNTHIPPGWSTTAYHKYGMLETSDGSTTVYICWFIDDVPQGCLQAPSNLTHRFVSRHFLVASIQAAGGSVPIVVNRDLDVKYLRVWSCPSWNGQDGDAAHMCNGDTLVTDSNGTYYKISSPHFSKG